MRLYNLSAMVVPGLFSSVMFTTSNQSIIPSGRKKLMIKSRSILDVCCSMVQRYEKYFFMYHICTIFSAKYASGSHGSFHLRPRIFIFSLCFVLIATMIWPTNMLVMTWQHLFPYILAALAGILIMFYISHSTLQMKWLSDRLIYIGDSTLDILTWHFLSFKLISLFLISLYSLPISRLAEFPVIEEYSSQGWWTLYLFSGVTFPLLGCHLINQLSK